MSQQDFITIDIRQAKVGLFVTLDLSWLEHPFLTSSFKIKDEKQLDLLKRLGLTTLRYNPERSDGQALELATTDQLTAPNAPRISAEEQAIIQAKQARIERLKEHRDSVTRCEKQLLEAASTLKSINRDLFSRPQETLRAAVGLVKQMADAMLVDREIALHAMNDKVGGEEVYFHSLNVSVLAMMLGKELKLTSEAINLLGLGALFHDIGKLNVPDKILRKSEPLSPSERGFLNQHPRYGEEIAAKLALPKAVVDIILHHHEFMDGSGYPDKLPGEQIQKLTRIVAVVNAFDILCNPVNPDRALTPYEAISTMFAKQRAKFDPVVLTTFIKFMGVYPPGTVVLLNNGLWGIVVSVNTARPTLPQVLVYDPEVPKSEAIILHLEDDPDMVISKTCRPNQLPSEVFDYLSPRRRVTYFYDEAKTGKTGASAA
jgi:putative nucleotidyltransferase with HDIG domain